jgi:hypothetical protein
MSKNKTVPIELLEDAAKLWLAHDGLWFQAIERKFGIDVAMELDKEAWSHFSPIEAHKIMKRHNIPHNGGLAALQQALEHRLYSHINDQTIEQLDDHTILLKMTDCRVQSARERKGMELFPCKEVGIVEYTSFAKAIDSRFEVAVVTCPPDTRPEDHYCAWKFTLSKED